MSYTMGVGCGPCSRNDEIDGDCICVDCVKGGYQCLPNNPDDGGKIRRMYDKPGLTGWGKTRGVPGMGSTDYGPRGQRQEFSNFVPAPNCWSGCPNPTAIYYQSAVGGAPCPPSHPNTQAPNCAPPPQQAPGITTTFVNNIQNGFNRFGCSFLYNRHGVLHNKLMQLQSAGTNPLWQQMLGNRINYINSVIMNNCTGGPTPGPTGGTPPPPGYGSNNPNNPTNPAMNYATNMGISQATQNPTMGY